MSRTAIWFPQGFSNLFHALSDIRNADVSGEFFLICSHPHPQFVGAEAADLRLVEPSKCTEDEFLEFALKTVKEHKVKVIVPTNRQKLFNRNLSKFAALGATVATPCDNDMLALINNKGSFYDHLADKGLVKIPAYLRVKTLEQFDAAYLQLTNAGHKLCVKPTVGVYGSGFRVLKQTGDTLKDLLSESLDMSVESLRARIIEDGGAELLVMQYLAGDERSVDCIAMNGELIGGVIRRKSSSSVAPQSIEHNPKLMEQVRALTKHLGLQGLFNVQFKDSGREHFLLEINTRLSGRSFYATLAGLNLPYLTAQLFSGKKRPSDLDLHLESGFFVGNVSTAVRLKAAV